MDVANIVLMVAPSFFFALLICGVLFAVYFCVKAIRAHGTRPGPNESNDEYMRRGCLIWGYLGVVLVVLALLLIALYNSITGGLL